MSDSNHSLVKKRLASELRIIILVQVVALGVVGLGLFLYCSKIVPNYPAWDEIHLLCGVLALSGMITFFVTTLWGFTKLMKVVFLFSILIKAYLIGGWASLFLLFFILFLPVQLPVYLEILTFIFPFYCVIPQFFIARWLAKEVKNDTMGFSQ